MKESLVASSVNGSGTEHRIGNNRATVVRGHAASANIASAVVDTSSPKVGNSSVNRRFNKSIRGNMNEYQDIFNSV